MLYEYGQVLGPQDPVVRLPPASASQALIFLLYHSKYGRLKVSVQGNGALQAGAH
jgi:hypothetical protein